MVDFSKFAQLDANYGDSAADYVDTPVDTTATDTISLEEKKLAKLNNLENNKQKKLGTVPEGFVKGTVASIQDGDTITLTNGTVIRTKSPFMRLDAAETSHGDHRQMPDWAPDWTESVADWVHPETTKSDYAMQKQREMVGRMIGKAPNDVTDDDIHSVGNYQSLKMLSALTNNGEKMFTPSYVQGGENKANLNDLASAGIQVYYDPTSGKGLHNRLTSPLYNANTGANITQAQALDPNFNAFAPAADKPIPQVNTTNKAGVDEMLKALKARESSGNYKADNKYGYIGAYQFGASRLADLGVVKRGTKNSDLNNPNVWTGKYGFTSKEKFLNDSKGQDKLAKIHILDLARQLKGSATDAADLRGKIFAAHLLGVQGSKNLNAVDGNNTSGMEYYKLGHNIGNDVPMQKNQKEMNWIERFANAGKSGVAMLGSTAADFVDGIADLAAKMGQTAYEELSNKKVTQKDLKNLEKVGFRVDKDGVVRHYWSWEAYKITSKGAFDKLLGVDESEYSKYTKRFNTSMDNIWTTDNGMSLYEKIGATVGAMLKNKKAIPQGVADSLAYFTGLAKAPLEMLVGTLNDTLEARLKRTGQATDAATTIKLVPIVAVELAADYIGDKLAFGVGKGFGAVNKKLIGALIDKAPKGMAEHAAARLIANVAGKVGEAALAGTVEEMPTEALQEALDVVAKRIDTDGYSMKNVWGLLDEKTKTQIRHAGWGGLQLGIGQSVAGNIARSPIELAGAARNKYSKKQLEAEINRRKEEANKAQTSLDIQKHFKAFDTALSQGDSKLQEEKFRGLASAFNTLSDNEKEQHAPQMSAALKTYKNILVSKANEGKNITRLGAQPEELENIINTVLAAESDKEAELLVDNLKNDKEFIAAYAKASGSDEHAIFDILDGLKADNKDLRAIDKVSNEVALQGMDNEREGFLAYYIAAKRGDGRAKQRLRTFMNKQANKKAKLEQARESAEAEIGSYVDRVFRAFSGTEQKAAEELMKARFGRKSELTKDNVLKDKQVTYGVYPDGTPAKFTLKEDFLIAKKIKKEIGDKHFNTLVNDNKFNIEGIGTTELDSLISEIDKEVGQMQGLIGRLDGKPVEPQASSTQEEAPTPLSTAEEAIAKTKAALDAGNVEEAKAALGYAWIKHPSNIKYLRRANEIIAKQSKQKQKASNELDAELVQKELQLKEAKKAVLLATEEEKPALQESVASLENTIKGIRKELEESTSGTKYIKNVVTVLSKAKAKIQKGIVNFTIAVNGKSKKLKVPYDVDKLFKFKKRNNSKLGAAEIDSTMPVMLRATTQLKKVLTGILPNGAEIKDSKHNELAKSPGRGILFTSEGKFNSNVVAAMAAAIADVFSAKGSAYAVLTDAQIEQLYGEDVPTGNKDKLRSLGMKKEYVASDIGNALFEALGIEIGDEAHRDVFDSIKTDLGQMAIYAARDMGIVDIVQMPTTDLQELMGQTVNAHKDSKSYFVKPTSTAVLAQQAELMKKLEDEVGIVSSVKRLRTKKRNTDKMEVKIRHNPYKKVNDIAVQTIKTNTNTKWELDLDTLKLLFKYDESVVKKALGYVEVDKNGVPIDGKRRAFDEAQGVNGKNIQIERSLEALKDAYEKVQNGEMDNEVYFDWFYGINGRLYLDSADINPQADKLHRFLVSIKTQATELDTSKGNEDSKVYAFKLGLAQAFGHAIDKEDFGGSLDFAEEILRMSDKQLNDFADKLMTDGKATFGGSNLFAGKGYEAKLEHLGHMLLGITEVRKWRKANGGKFTTKMKFEADATTSGVGLKLMQIPIGDALEWLAKAGIIVKDKDGNYPEVIVNALADYDVAKLEQAIDEVVKNMGVGDLKATGKFLDSYQTLAQELRSDKDIVNMFVNQYEAIKSDGELTNKAKELQEKAGDIGIKNTNNVEKTFTAFKDLLGENAAIMKDGKVTSFGRNLFKYPFMIFLYGAGPTRIKKELLSTLEGTVVDSIINADNGMDAKITEAFKLLGIDLDENSLETLKQDLQDKPVKDVVIGGTNMAQIIEVMYGEFYGTAVANVMKDKFKELIATNEAINSVMRGLTRVYTKAKDKLVEDATVDGIKPNEQQLKDIDQKLDVLFPAVSHPLGNADRSDGIAVFDTIKDMEDSTLTASTLVKENGKTVSKSISLKTKKVVEAITAGAIMLTHTEDGAIMTLTMADGSLFGVHDALVLGVDQVDKIREYHKNMMRISKNWDQVYEVLKAVEATTKAKVEGLDVGELFTEMLDEDAQQEEHEQINFVGSINMLKGLLEETAQARERIHNTAQVGHVAFGNKGMLDLSNDVDFKETYGTISKLEKWSSMVPEGRFRQKITRVINYAKKKGCS